MAKMYYRCRHWTPHAIQSEERSPIIGYGSQGHAHALNLAREWLRPSSVGLYEGSPSWAKAERDGLKVQTRSRQADRRRRCHHDLAA